MRKTPQYVVQMPTPEINLDLGNTVQPFALSSAGFAPNRDKDMYPVDDIKDPTPCTLIYVKGRTSKIVEVAKATVMPSHILHGWPIPAECAVVEVTTIGEGCEFEDLDYPDEDEGIEKLVNAKGTFILWPRKDITIKTQSSPIVSPQSIEARGTPTSNMSKLAQSSHPSATLPPAQNRQDPELQETTGRRSPSPARDSQSPQDSMELRPPSPTQDFHGPQDSMELRPPSPPARDSQGLELQDNSGHRPPSPLARDSKGPEL
jgi:hypothetical protein